MLHASDKCDLVVGSYSDRLSIFTILTLLVVESPIGENKGFNKKIDGPEPIPKTAFMPLDDTIRYPKGVIIKNYYMSWSYHTEMVQVYNTLGSH